MNREYKEPKPISKIQLNDQHSKLRMLIVVILAIIGIAAFSYGIRTWLTVDSEWTEIEIYSKASNKHQKEFTLGYQLGASGTSAKGEKRVISKLCGSTLKKAYEIFDSIETYDGVMNVAYINRHPNEIITVDPVLYQAFELLEKYGNRNVFLAPIYEDYSTMFFCKNDSEAINFDPYQNEQVKDYVGEVCRFVQAEEAVRIDLLEENQIQLVVSDAYLDFAKEYEITKYIDFFWMENAFIVDYIAKTMQQYTLTRGTISSYDGFVRNLDNSGTTYAYPIVDREGQHVYPAATMQYNTARNFVYLRNYSFGGLDVMHYYEWANGEIRTAYIDARDGLCKSSTDNLIGYSKDLGCAEILLQMSPVYIADQFQPEQLDKLKEQGISTIYCDKYEIRYNDPELMLSDLYTENGVSYSECLIDPIKINK